MHFSGVTSSLKKIPQYHSYLKQAGDTQIPRFKWVFFLETIVSSLIYGTSFSEFAGYGFYKKNGASKRAYMTRRYMFDFFDKYNPIEYRERIGNKAQAKQYYSQFLQREQFEYEQGEESFYRFVEKHPRIFIKKKIGWGGDGARIEMIDSHEKAQEIWQTLSKNYVVEPVLENHPDIKKVNPDCLNTIKVTTLFLNDGPEIQSAIIRFGNRSIVDNVHSGGIAAGINLETGRIETEAIDRHFKRYQNHPVTNEPILGSSIPMWTEVKQLAEQAASVTPEIRYASWDIAVTPLGPVLIEGNWDAEFKADQMLYDRGSRKRYIEKLERKKDRT